MAPFPLDKQTNWCESRMAGDVGHVFSSFVSYISGAKMAPINVICRDVVSISFKRFRSSEDPCSADTNLPIGHHI